MELLLAYLGKTLNLPSEEVAELLYKKSDDGTLTDQLNETALESLLAKDAERVQALKGSADTKQVFDNGYKKGQKEALEQLEKTVRAEFKADVDKQGIDLVKHVVAQAAKTKLGDDEVKVHPYTCPWRNKRRRSRNRPRRNGRANSKTLKPATTGKKHFRPLHKRSRNSLRHCARYYRQIQQPPP